MTFKNSLDSIFLLYKKGQFITNTMDEVAFYCSKGSDADKKHLSTFGYLSSTHSPKQYLQYRQCYCDRNGAVLTGVGQETKLITACYKKALIQVYLYGKEAPEQRIPIPEPLTCIQIIDHPTIASSSRNSSENWLLVGGSSTGRLYVWELSSGLLLAVKECHYQSMTVIKQCNNYIVTGGADSRVTVWKITDLISDYIVRSQPYAVFSNHTLPVTDIVVSAGLDDDAIIYSSSEDSTIRCYGLVSKQLLTTFVLPQKVTSLASDPSFRALYAGLQNGTIRVINLYKADPSSHVLEAVGGLGKVITLKPDLNNDESIACIQGESADKNKSKEENAITKTIVNIDGTTIICGDMSGYVFIVDIRTKQIQRKLKTLSGPVSQILLFNAMCDDKKLTRDVKDKRIIRNIPILKRVVVDSEIIGKHEITKRLGHLESTAERFDVDEFINTVQSQQKCFENTGKSEIISISGSNASTATKLGETAELKKQLEQMGASFSTLKSKYEELYKEYATIANK